MSADRLQVAIASVRDCLQSVSLPKDIEEDTSEIHTLQLVRMACLLTMQLTSTGNRCSASIPLAGQCLAVDLYI